MRTYGSGCNRSKIDGTEKIFASNIQLPSRFSLTSIMPPILDQGSTSKCVAYSLIACLDYIKNLSENDNDGEQFSIDYLYNLRSNRPDDGMDIKNGLHILVHNGVKQIDNKNHNIITRLISGYAKVNSDVHLKCALMLNGPCPIALPVKSYDQRFWAGGKNVLGYHCVVVTGYDERGFEIRNSWGRTWGVNGYTHITYDDFRNNVLEIWTLFKK